MSRRFRFTVNDDIGLEIEQYIYGKYGSDPAKNFEQMVLAQMSKNPLTTQQINRIRRKYGDTTIDASVVLSGTAEGQ